jgi:hypothetical protein
MSFSGLSVALIALATKIPCILKEDFDYHNGTNETNI